jgi:hypothetical protein
MIKGATFRLHDLIIGLYPGALVDMQYKMPTYHHGEGWVALANQKHYVSLYTCGAYHLARFKEQHPDIRTGKGCINFKVSDKLPLPGLKQVIQHAMEHPMEHPKGRQS